MIDYLVETIKLANEAVMKIYGNEGREVWEKAGGSPLTEADLASSDIICARLRLRFPEIPIICEETANESWEIRKEWKECWIVDPLDGTKEFIARNGQFTTNIGLWKGGEVVAGFVGIPVSGDIFWAVRGQGVWKMDNRGNTEMINDQYRRRFADGYYKIIASRSHMSDETKQYIDEIKWKQEMGGKVVKIVNVGSSIKFIWLVEGKADIYVRLSPCMEWDTCAAQMLVEEAGGKIVVVGEGADANTMLKYNKESLYNPFFVATI